MIQRNFVTLGIYFKNYFNWKINLKTLLLYWQLIFSKISKKCKYLPACYCPYWQYTTILCFFKCLSNVVSSHQEALNRSGPWLQPSSCFLTGTVLISEHLPRHIYTDFTLPLYYVIPPDIHHALTFPLPMRFLIPDQSSSLEFLVPSSFLNSNLYLFCPSILVTTLLLGLDFIMLHLQFLTLSPDSFTLASGRDPLLYTRHHLNYLMLVKVLWIESNN